MVNFYHKFIPNLADLAAPFKSLRKKGASFVWGAEQQESVEALKRAIAQPLVLRMADFNKKFILQTDASGVALAETDRVRQPIAYSSRTLSAQERKAPSIYEL
jgi:hypothetical protein